MAHIGYLGVVVPERDLWQGYFIDDLFARTSHETVERMRTALKTADIGRSKVLHPFANVADADQVLLGGLCATIVSAAIGEIPEPDMTIGSLGYAVSELIHAKFYWIHGKIETKGIVTNVASFDVSSIDQCRDMIEGLLVVRDIKRRLLQQLRERRNDRLN